MDQDIKDIELIEDWRKGTLSDQELTAFEERYARDEDFRRKAEDYSRIMSEIRLYGQQGFMDKLRQWDTEIAGEKKPKVIPLRRYLSIAAAILVILIPVGYLLLSDMFPADHQELYTSYFHPYDDVISERSGDSGLLEKGLSAYNLGNYNQAVTWLGGYLEENPGQYDAATYLAISHLALGETDKASAILSDVSKNSSGLFREVSEWYLALAYLKSEQTAALEQQLELILAQPDHMYHLRALELQQAID